MKHKKLNTGLSNLPDEAVEEFLKNWGGFKFEPMEPMYNIPPPNTPEYKEFVLTSGREIAKRFREKYLNE